MSDYMYMLESHLNPAQSRVVTELEAVAGHANVNLFLTGGAMRDMFAGHPVRDLDFTVEGNALKLARALAQRPGVKLLAEDEERKSAELLFSGEIRAAVAMAQQARYGKPGAKPRIQPATIHEDLRGRDFSINSVALSLNRASRGLLLDPNNGLGDLERKEIRAISNYTLYDEPVRLLRLLRLKVRLGFTIEARTQLQYENAREAGMESQIAPRLLFEELRAAADEPNPADLVQTLEQENLLRLFHDKLTGPKLPAAGLSRLQKARQLVPYGVDLRVQPLGLFLYFFAEKLSAKERAELIANVQMHKSEVGRWQKLEAGSRGLERALKSAKLHKPSQVYRALIDAAGEHVLFLLIRSEHRIVQDRIRNYLQKYLPAAQEVTDQDVVAAGGQPGSPKFAKQRDDLINARLDGRARKPVPPPVVEPPAPPPAPARVSPRLAMARR